MLESLFSALGIPKNEARIYLALADLGKAPATVLSKRLELPRSTVYTCLDSLERRELISKDTVSDVTIYQARPAESISELVEHDRLKAQQALAEKQAARNQLIPLLRSKFRNKNFSVPNLEFFEGSKGIEKMLYTFERTWQQSISQYDSTWWGYQDHHFVESYRGWLDTYWASMLENERINLLSNASKTESKLKKMVPKRSIKTVGPDTEISSTIWVLGDYVVTIMTRQQPHYAFQLHDAVFAANQRTVFKMLWNAL